MRSKDKNGSGLQVPGEAMLSVRGVCVSYGDFCALRDASFLVNPGEWVMLAGPNGAGKSTLLSALSGSIASTGDIFLNGQDARKMNPAAIARRMAVLTQHHPAQYAFTVREVVALGRYAHRRYLRGCTEEDEQAVQRALDRTGLSGLADQSILHLSGGEVQRVFLAQVFAQGADLLLLDEPTNHLDLQYQKQIFEMLQSWLQGGRRAIISVVHDLSLARKFGTRAILLDRGEIRADGAPQEALSRGMLQEIWGMDVYSWMQDLLIPWTK